MPGFPDMGGAQHRRSRRIPAHRATTRARSRRFTSDPSWLKYRIDGETLFRDPDGYPPITPPWGTLNAIDLNAGTIRWQIPFGEYPGAGGEGTEEHRQRQLRRPDRHRRRSASSSARRTSTGSSARYDKRTGKLLWETTLPAAGNATPATYTIDGKQYVVIVCGGGKNGAPSGSSIVAFTLP